MRVFYGSSREFSEVLHTLIRRVNFGEALHWEAAFPNGRNYLNVLIEVSDQIDCAVFLMAPEDNLKERGSNYLTPRDNLIFEAGIMMHALGPENVYLIYPETDQADDSANLHSAAPRLKHLSDLSGIKHLTCSKINPTGSVLHFEAALADVPSRIRDGISALKFKKPTFYIDGIFPIYNYLYTPDWHEAFRSALERKYIDPKLMYYGPGLARYWFKMADSELYRRKDEIFQQKVQNIFEKLDMSGISSGEVSIIDLGIGNGRLGRCVINTVDNFVSDKCGISYIALDISQDMLLSAMRDEKMQECLRSIKDRGNSFGVCGDFYQLGRIKILIPEKASKIFLLLGNTLGNERDEVALLTAIKRTMADQDVLILEMCIAHSMSSPEIRSIDSNDSTFDTGSFRCFGLLPEELEVREVIEPRNFGMESSYQVKCIKSRKLYHPAVAPFQVQDEWFDMMHVRRYIPEAFDEILSRSGLVKLHTVDVSLIMGGEENFFRYVAVRKQKA